MHSTAYFFIFLSITTCIDNCSLNGKGWHVPILQKKNTFNFLRGSNITIYVLAKTFNFISIQVSPSSSFICNSLWYNLSFIQQPVCIISKTTIIWRHINLKKNICNSFHRLFVRYLNMDFNNWYSLWVLMYVPTLYRFLNAKNKNKVFGRIVVHLQRPQRQYLKTMEFNTLWNSGYIISKILA